MTTSQESKLNFYSKYNRVRDKQDIDSLYALIDDTDHYISHFQQMIFTLNCSRASDSDEGSPIRQFHTQQKSKRSKDGNVLGVFQEEEKDVKFKEMEEKLKKLERLEKNFHEQLDKSQREYRRKKELKEAKRKEREYYRNQLINVIEHTSEQSQQSRVSQNDLLQYGENITSQVFENPMPEDEDDYYAHTAQVKINDRECSYDVKETKRKLKEILEMQRKREREVESVEENVDGKTSSIVIERLNIMPKTLQRNEGFSPDFEQQEMGKEKEGKNYCEVELNHSQSQNVLRNVRSFDKLVKDQAAEAHEQVYEGKRTNTPYEEQHNAHTNTEQHFQPESMHHSNPNFPYNHHQNYENQHQHGQAHFQEEQPRQDRQKLIEEEQHESELYEAQEAVEDHHQPHNHNYNYSEHDHIDPPLTLAQESGNNQFTIEDASEINEEIADKVISIQGHSEQQSQPAHNNVNNRSPLFLSQTNPRKIFHSQYEVQSIAESLDFHPLQNQSPERRQSKSEIVYGDKEQKSRNEASDNPGDKKTSFKKLMAENRANLIPRLAISTILNEHINQALGDYRTNTPPPPPVPVLANLHESIISNSEGNSSFVKPGKVNFKSLLQKSKKNTSRDKAVVTPKDPAKQQANKKLLMSFFDQN